MPRASATPWCWPGARGASRATHRRRPRERAGIGCGETDREAVGGSRASERDLPRLLHDWRAGDESSRDRLLAEVYDTLRDMASQRLHRGRAGHTLQPTAVLNEALLRILGTDDDWEDRAHLFALASRKMRAVLVDHARARAADKRGG